MAKFLPSTKIIEAAKQVFAEHSEKEGWEWNAFYEGFLQGYFFFSITQDETTP